MEKYLRFLMLSYFAIIITLQQQTTDETTTPDEETTTPDEETTTPAAPTTTAAPTVPPQDILKDLAYCDFNAGEHCDLRANRLGDFIRDGDGCQDDSIFCPLFKHYFCPMNSTRCRRTCGQCVVSENSLYSPKAVDKDVCLSHCDGSPDLTHYDKISNKCFHQNEAIIKLQATQTLVKAKSGCTCSNNRYPNSCDYQKFCVFISYRRENDTEADPAAGPTAVRVCLRNCHPNQHCDCLNQDRGCKSLSMYGATDFGTFKNSYFEFDGECKGLQAFIKFRKGNDLFEIQAVGLSLGACPP